MVGAAPRLAEVDDRLLRRLDEAWGPARAAGALGAASLHSLRLHAASYICDEWRQREAGRFVDCGAGAGVLGILLAWELPYSQWILIDSNERRCELARLAASAADVAERVTVEHATVEEAARRPASRGSFDGAVARLFGPVPELAECGLPLLKHHGMLVVSVSEATRRVWEQLPLETRTGCEIVNQWMTPSGSFLAVKRIGPIPAGIPRRKPARRRSPLM